MLTNDEIKTAMRQKLPVVCHGIVYAYINEYIMSYDRDGNRKLSVSLMDMNKHAVLRASLEHVSLLNANE